MANTDKPRGGIAVGNIDGKEPQLGKKYSVDASNGTAIFIGDFITQEADGNVTPAAAGGIIVGVCTAVLNDFDDLSRRHLPASTAGDIMVVDDPDTTFELQEDNAGTALTSAAVGGLVDILATAGSTTTSLSAHEFDRSTIGTADGQLRLLRLIDREDNEFGDFAKWEVTIVEHRLRLQTGI